MSAKSVKKPEKTSTAKKPVDKRKPEIIPPSPEDPVIFNKRNINLKPAKKKPRSNLNRVPPKIGRKAPVIVKAPPKPVIDMDSSKSAAFAKSIALEMKRCAQQADEVQTDGEIKLSRRPTTRTQGKATEKFPENDLRDFRRRLLDAREAALNGVNAIRATGFNESDDHEADGGDGTNQTLRLQALGQMGNINRTIQQIEEALHRIEDGSYGVCTVCGQLIRKPRLINQPFVLTCMECQSEMERSKR